jgi:hypothetical protein
MKHQSLDHEAHPFTEEDLARWSKYERELIARGCRISANCRQPITHWLRYRYWHTSSRKWLWSIRYSCKLHAVKFAERFKIQITEGKLP